MLSIFKMNMGGVNKTPFQKKMLAWIHGYDHDKYWHRRSKVVNPNFKMSKIIKLYYL